MTADALNHEAVLREHRQRNARSEAIARRCAAHETMAAME